MSQNSRICFLISSIILIHVFSLEAKPSKNLPKEDALVAITAVDDPKKAVSDANTVTDDSKKTVLDATTASLSKDVKSKENKKATLEATTVSTLDNLGDNKPLEKKIIADAHIAAGNGQKPSSQPYSRDLKPSSVDGVFGFDASYARLAAIENDDILSIAALEPVGQQILNTHSVTGGFGWRLYGNGVMNITPVFGVGAEIAFSYYPHSTFSQKLNLTINSTHVIAFTDIKTHGYGVDFLVDFRFNCLSNFFISFKPGMQLAYQRNTVSGDLNLGSLLGSIPPLGGYNRYQICQFLPEIVLAADWNFIEGFMGRWGISAHMTFQHVWGQDSAGLQNLISSRDMFGGGFAVRF